MPKTDESAFRDPLRKLIKSNPILQEVHSGSPTAAVILGHEFLSDLLRDLFTAKFPRSIPLKRQRDLLEYPGCLHSASARMNLAYCLGLVPKAVYLDLMAFRRIRNHCAHHIHPVEWQDREVREEIDKLAGWRLLGDKGFKLPRPKDRYLGTLMVRSMQLAKYAHEADRCVVAEDVAIVRS